jgi:hypothetical protein
MEASEENIQEELNAIDLPPNPEKTEPEVEHEEVPKEEGAVETFGVLKEQCGGEHLAVGCCRQSKKQAQVNGGSQKKLPSTCRWITRYAGVAQHKEHCHKGTRRDNRKSRR